MLKIHSFYSLFIAIAFFSNSYTPLYGSDILPCVKVSTYDKVSQNVSYLSHALGAYYQQMGRTDYCDEKGMGLFMKWTKESNNMDICEMLKNLNNNQMDDDIASFDKNFPFPMSIHDYQVINDNQKKEIKFKIIHFCYKYGKAPSLQKLKSFLNNNTKTSPSDDTCAEQTNLVFGYVRESENLFKLFIPNGVKLICLLFYYGKDYFDDGCMGKLIRTHNDQQIITMKKNNKEINTAYGFLHIKPLSPQANKIYTWKFKIISCHGYIYIGVAEARALWKDHWFAGRRNTTNYSYCCNGRKYSHRTGGMGQSYSQGFYVGSVVLMELDLASKSGMLSFGIMKYGNDWQNDAFFSVTPAFKYIKKNSNLKMAVNLRAGSAVQLLEYKEEIPPPKSKEKGQRTNW